MPARLRLLKSCIFALRVGMQAVLDVNPEDSKTVAGVDGRKPIPPVREAHRLHRIPGGIQDRTSLGSATPTGPKEVAAPRPEAASPLGLKNEFTCSLTQGRPLARPTLGWRAQRRWR